MTIRGHVAGTARHAKTNVTLPNLRYFFPKGLRGRAVLILLFPVIMVQLVVAAVFIQKHHDLVTRQMVFNVEPHIRLVLSRINSAADIEDAIERITPITVPGNLKVTIDPESVVAAEDRRLFYDFSGKIVIDTVRGAIPSITAVDLLTGGGSFVTIRADTTLGNTDIVLARRAVSPSNPHQLLILMVVTGIILTAIAYAFLRNQLKPIIRLAAASKAFGKGQRIDLTESGATEVREATRAFLDMRERIESHIEQRTQMLSSISHDLKTPLARLRVGLELLEQSPETEELIADVKHMASMLREFVEFSKYAKLEEPQDIEASALARDICRDARLPGRSLSLVMDDAVQSGRIVNVRPKITRRAVQNLVQNAFHHAPSTRLSVTLNSGLLSFIVEDDGFGIPENQRKLALRPFARLDASRNLSNLEGVGLGLAIAEDISNSQGGSLTLDASEDMGGLKATISLPVSELDGISGGDEQIDENNW